MNSDSSAKTGQRTAMENRLKTICQTAITYEPTGLVCTAYSEDYKAQLSRDPQCPSGYVDTYRTVDKRPPT